MEPAPLPPPPQPAAAPAEDQHSLSDVLLTATAWSAALLAAVSPTDRLALFGTSSGCQQSVQQTADSATATLITYSGQSEATWRRRLAGVERGLSARQQRTNRLVVRVQTPNPTALQSLLAIAGPAGGAVTELEVRQVSSREAPDQGVSTAWLAGLPAAFPRLRVLSLSGLCGKLPAPAQLPYLRGLHVRLCHSTHPDSKQVLGSIAPYTTQLTSLSLSPPHTEIGELKVALPHTLVFTTLSHSLTSVGVRGPLTDQLVHLLRTKVPNLRRLAFQYSEQISPDHAGATWGAREIVTRCSTSEVFASLPGSPEGVQLSPADGTVRFLHFEVAGSQGLPEAVRQRMPTWQLQGRCQAYLVVPAALPVNEQRAGVLAAIQQLHDHLPPDSRLSFNCPRSLITYVYETIATLAPTLPNITLLAPSMYGNEEAALVPWACRQAPAVPHVAFRVTRSYADQPWPWRSLCVGANPLQTPWLTDILKLPDPTTGQYDIDIGGFRVDKVTHAQMLQLQERAEHLTIVMCRNWSFEIVAANQDAARHPAMLRMLLQVLKSFKWRCESSFPPAITLQGWSLTPAVLHELKALPDLGFTVSLDFTDCDWSVCTDYEGLASWVSALPACYALGTVRSSDSHGACTGRHLQALCRGAAQRPSGLAKTVLSFSMASCYQTPSDAERSAVHRYIEEQGLGEKVEVDWDPSEHLCVHLC